MQRTTYNSNAGSKISSLAEATWQEFNQFVSRYQWAFENPSHSPRAAEIASAIMNRGRKGCCTFWRDGYKYILPVMHTRHFDQAVNYRKIYYVSHGRQALLYLDTDLHYAWQRLEDGQKAQSLLDRLMSRFFGESVLFSSPSERGGNDYLKVNLGALNYQRANDIFVRLEKALQLFLAYCDNMADFEIKGTLGYFFGGKYVWGKYGKLPIHRDWNFKKLEEFKSKPTVSIYRLETLCRQIEARIPFEVLERHKALKKSKGDQPFIKKGEFLVTPAIEKMLVEKHGEGWRWMLECHGDQDGTWIDLRYFRPGEVPLTPRELREALTASQVVNEQLQKGQQQQSDSLQPSKLNIKLVDLSTEAQPKTGQQESDSLKPNKTMPSKLNITVTDLPSETDSFKRQKEALFRLARSLKRVPSVDEALQFIKSEELFTGCWQDNLGRRKARIHSILKWIANTFDASKCANGSVNIGKYDAWANTRFPNGLIGKGKNSMTEDGELIHSFGDHVKPEFISIFMSICEFSLRIDKNLDSTLPHKRAEHIWEALYAKGLVSIPFLVGKPTAYQIEWDKWDKAQAHFTDNLSNRQTKKVKAIIDKYAQHITAYFAYSPFGPDTYSIELLFADADIARKCIQEYCRLPSR